MPDRDAATTARHSTTFRLAGRNVRIEAPDRILTVLDATLAGVPRGTLGSPDITLGVTVSDDAWTIDGGDGTRQVLSRAKPLPQVAGALVSTAVRRVATSLALTTMRATVMEHRGRALAMVGDDWESAITLATHLHGRGWNYVGADNALLDSSTRHVAGIQKSLYVNASSILQLPTRYRRAVEASPWYVTAQGISFYAVDPSVTGIARTWSPAATLCALVIVDGTMADNAALESVDAHRLADERFARFGLDWDLVGVADLHIGGCVGTADLIEHWFGSLPS